MHLNAAGQPQQSSSLQGITEGWPAQHDWVLADGGINLDFLDQHFGGSQVMATDTSRCEPETFWPQRLLARSMDLLRSLRNGFVTAERCAGAFRQGAVKC